MLLADGWSEVDSLSVPKPQFFDKVCDFIVCNLIDVGVYGIKLSPLESMSDSVLVRRCEDKLTILSCL